MSHFFGLQAKGSWIHLFPGLCPRLGHSQMSQQRIAALRILTPPMETPDPPSDTPGVSKKVFLTPHDIPRILRVVCLMGIPLMAYYNSYIPVRMSSLIYKINNNLFFFSWLSWRMDHSKDFPPKNVCLIQIWHKLRVCTYVQVHFSDCKTIQVDNSIHHQLNKRKKQSRPGIW